MKRVRTVTVLAMTVSGVMLFGAMSPVVSQPPAERQTITLFDPRPTQYEKFLNEGRRGISPGDTIMFIERQLDPETCERAGKLTGTLRVIRVVGREDAVYQGNFTVSLENGKIVAEAVARFSDFERTEPIFAVTGGTETYRDASGEVTIQEGTPMCDLRGDTVTIDVGPTP